MHFLFLLILLTFFSTSLFSLSFSDNGTPEELAAAIEQAMTDEQALAQVFMLGWVGAEPSPLIMDWIRDRNIGGVKIFGWNTEDTTLLARTVGALQEASLKGITDQKMESSVPGLFAAGDVRSGTFRQVVVAAGEGAVAAHSAVEYIDNLRGSAYQ